MDVLIAKVLSLLGILMFSIIFGIAPIYLEKFIRSPNIRWINNAIICFSGGTLLGISFLHLMPEMRESYYGLKKQGRLRQNMPLFTRRPFFKSHSYIVCGH